MAKRRWHAIFKRLPDGKEIKVAEVGVWIGMLSQYLLKYRPLMHLTMVDRWSVYNEDERSGDQAGKMTRYDQRVFDEAKSQAISSTDKYKMRRTVIEMDSLNAAKKVRVRSFDLVFIDADHSYDAVKKDIAAWLPKVKKGGWISGHDYTRGSVKKAVDEIFKDVEVDSDRTWFVKV